MHVVRSGYRPGLDRGSRPPLTAYGVERDQGDVQGEAGLDVVQIDLEDPFDAVQPVVEGRPGQVRGIGRRGLVAAVLRGTVRRMRDQVGPVLARRRPAAGRARARRRSAAGRRRAAGAAARAAARPQPVERPRPAGWPPRRRRGSPRRKRPRVRADSRRRRGAGGDEPAPRRRPAPRARRRRTRRAASTRSRVGGPRQQDADAGVVERADQGDAAGRSRHGGAPRSRRGRAAGLLGLERPRARPAVAAAARRRPAAGRPAGRRAPAPAARPRGRPARGSRMPVSSVRWVCRSRLSRSRSSSRLRASVDAPRSSSMAGARGPGSGASRDAAIAAAPVVAAGADRR